MLLSFEGKVSVTIVSALGEFGLGRLRNSSISAGRNITSPPSFMARACSSKWTRHGGLTVEWVHPDQANIHCGQQGR